MLLEYGQNAVQCGGELMKNKPLLTIACITYNHGKFIRETLDSFVTQQTNFPFIALVADDGSTDDTPIIIQEYAQKYPNIIKPILHPKNLGVWENILSVYTLIESEFVALCEGDDYWTDINKLQKQVDFLKGNEDYSICFHPVVKKWEDHSEADSIFPSPALRFFKTTLSMNNMMIDNFMATNSVVYRWKVTQNLLDSLQKDFSPQDYFFHLYHAKVGKIKFLNETMGVYRKHFGGVWMGAGETDNWYAKNTYSHVRLSQEIERWFDGDKFYTKYYMIRELVVRMALLEQRNRKESDEYVNLYEEYKRVYQIEADICQSIISDFKHDREDRGRRLVQIRNIIKYTGYSLISKSFNTRRAKAMTEWKEAKIVYNYIMLNQNEIVGI